MSRRLDTRHLGTAHRPADRLGPGTLAAAPLPVAGGEQINSCRHELDQQRPSRDLVAVNAPRNRGVTRRPTDEIAQIAPGQAVASDVVKP